MTRLQISSSIKPACSPACGTFQSHVVSDRIGCKMREFGKAERYTSITTLKLRTEQHERFIDQGGRSCRQHDWLLPGHRASKRTTSAATLKLNHHSSLSSAVSPFLLNTRRCGESSNLRVSARRHAIDSPCPTYQQGSNASRCHEQVALEFLGALGNSPSQATDVMKHSV